ncbi:hypothetical protein ACIG3E_32665 [Streptomyces sp. NPDC053474]|uniref:hypothetical protein n=1 Tax=Streptomyces sp. NPDC053474 TaxID=3365704 RepID=UPI0037D915CF
MPHSFPVRDTGAPALLCPATLTDAALMQGVLTVLSDQQLASVAIMLTEETQRRLMNAITTEIRAAVTRAVEERETDSPAPVVRAQFRVRDTDSMPPYWDGTDATLRHTDGRSTRHLDTSDTRLEELLNDFTCVKQPSARSVLTIDLRTGGFHY